MRHIKSLSDKSEANVDRYIFNKNAIKLKFILIYIIFFFFFKLIIYTNKY